MTAREQGQGVAPPDVARCSRCGKGTPTAKRQSWRPFGRHIGWINACCQQRQVPGVAPESETPAGQAGASLQRRDSLEGNRDE